jgi:hypothetical protein
MSMQSKILGTQKGVLVLVGQQSGVTVIPNPTPLTRLNYFDGKFLRAQDLQAEQRYLRYLVELSNQANGSGIVHGFDLALGSGDKLTIQPGLAIDPQGRVLLLPQECALSIQDLLDRSRSTQSLFQTAATATTGGFEICQEVSATPVTAPFSGRDWYLLTIAHAEALCGEEDVYGKLCEEACITSTDRPWRLEGVVVRLHPLPLNTQLTKSTAVSLGAVHLRSQLASAWFADEAGRLDSLISKAGLESSVWCHGAADFTGSEVALGVLVRQGGTTLFLDEWIARREIMDTPARRYWQWRMRQRSWDVYLAHILQFQCQLRDAFGKAPTTPVEDDPCSQAKYLVAEAAEHLKTLTEFYQATTTKLVKMAPSERLDVLGAKTIPQVDFTRMADLRHRLEKAKLAFEFLPQDRLLIQRGIVELPSAGYLPVVPSSTLSVNQQVKRLLGEGLDLRFCLVRPDFVAHALEEAQHLDRISLLTGLDNPMNKQEVDILVPDGQFAPDLAEQGRYYEMHLQVNLNSLELLLSQAEDAASGKFQDKGTSVENRIKYADKDTIINPSINIRSMARVMPVTLELNGAGRSEDLPNGGVAFLYAGGTESSVIGPYETDKPEAINLEQPVREPGVERMSTTGATNRSAFFSLRPEFFKSRVSNVVSAASESPGELGVRSSTWLSLELDRDPSILARGASTPATAEWHLLFSEVAKASNPNEIPHYEILLRTKFTGDLQVQAQETQSGQEQVRRTKAVLAGEFMVTIRSSSRQRSFSLYLSETVHILSRMGSYGRNFEFEMPTPAVLPLVQNLGGRREWATPTEAESRSYFFPQVSHMPKAEVEVPSSYYLFLTGEIINPSVFEPNHPAHESSIRALRAIGAALGKPKFADLAAARLFPSSPAVESELTVLANLDWVLFHRRRDKVCRAEKPVVLIPSRYYALYQMPLTGDQNLSFLQKLLESGNVANLPKNFIQLVEFAPGIHAVATQHNQVRAGWQQEVGSADIEIIGGLVASRGLAAAEGDQLAEDRLESLVDVLRADTPLAAAPEYVVLRRVPEALDTGQNDGIMIVATKSLATTCQDVYAVEKKDAFGFVMESAQNDKLIEALNEIKAIHLGQVSFRAGTSQDISETTAAVAAKWADTKTNWGVSTEQPLDSALLVFTKGDAAASIYKSQAKALVQALGGANYNYTTEVSTLPPSACPALTIIVPQTGRTVRLLVALPTAISHGTGGLNMVTDPALVLTFAATGALTPEELPDAVVGWFKTNLIEKNLASNSISLIVQTPQPDDQAAGRLEVAVKKLKDLGVVKPEAPATVTTMNEITVKNAELANLLQPYFSSPTRVDDLLFMVLPPR